MSRRSLVEFRRRLAIKDPEMKLIRTVFDSIRDSALQKLGLSTSNQRLDSTHIISNIRTRGRLALFTTTIDLFLKGLSDDQFSRVPQTIRTWHTTESEGWFGLEPTEQKVKLGELAHYLYELIIRFETDETVKASERYQLLVRLFSEQCDFEKDPHTDTESDNKIKVKKDGRNNTPITL